MRGIRIYLNDLYLGKKHRYWVNCQLQRLQDLDLTDEQHQVVSHIVAELDKSRHTAVSNLINMQCPKTAWEIFWERAAALFSTGQENDAETAAG